MMHIRNIRAFPVFRWLPTWMRFGLVGVVNTGFSYVIFALLVMAGVWPGAALVGAAFVGVIFNFQTARRLVFRSNGHLARFVAVYIVVLILNWAVLMLLHWCGLPDLESQAILILPIAGIAFLGQRDFVFNTKR